MGEGLVQGSEVKEREMEESEEEGIEVGNWEMENSHLGESETGEDDTEESDHFEDCNLIIKNHRKFFGRSVNFLTTDTPRPPVFTNCTSTAPL